MVQSTTLPLTLLHLLLVTWGIAIGITPEILQQTIPVGPLHQAISQFTTHVQPVGVFLTEVVTVYGQSQDWVPHYTTVQMGECLSVYHLLPQHGILLRVIVTTSMAVSTMSVSAAAIGLPLLSTATRTA